MVRGPGAERPGLVPRQDSAPRPHLAAPASLAPGLTFLRSGSSPWPPSWALNAINHGEFFGAFHRGPKLCRPYSTSITLQLSDSAHGVGTELRAVSASQS